MDEEVQTGISSGESQGGAVEQETTEAGSVPADETTEGTSDATAEKPEISQTKDSANEGEDVDLEGGSGEQTIPYSRFKEVNDRLKEAEQATRLLQKLQEDPDLASEFLRRSGVKSDGPEDPQLVQADKTLKEMGYLKVKEAISMAEDIVERKIAQREFVQKMLDLEKQYDGTGGAPKFIPEKVAEYMDKKGIPDPETAYEVMHKDELADYRAKQKKRGAYSEKGGQPRSTAGEDPDALLKKAKEGGNWEEYLLRAKGLSVPGRG